MSLEEYSVSDRGLRSRLVGTPEQVLERVRAFEEAGVDLLLLQCSPQFEEMERFAAQVIEPYRRWSSGRWFEQSLGVQAALAEGLRVW